MKMKKILAAFLAIVMMVMVVPVSVVAESDGYYTYTVSDGEATITDVDETISGDVVIPDELGGYPVTSIGYSAFYYCKSLTSVTIPDSVTSIGYNAFYYCSSLKSVTIPDSVTSIGSYAFYCCSSLTSVTIPDSVTKIDGNAFADCTRLTSVHITDIVAWLDINFGEGAANPLAHGRNLYLNGELVTELVIPDGVTEIKNNAFSCCSSLTSVTIPDSVTSIGYNAFYYCTSLTSVTIPDSVTSIGKSAFYNCTSLTSVTIGNGVTSIGEETFYSCTSLTSVTIPDSVTSIGKSAFYNCYNLRGVHITDVAAWCNISFYRYDTNPLYYARNLYLNDVLVTDLVIPEGVAKIKNYAFYNYGKLTSVTIPDSVTSIGEEAFRYCSSLTSVVIPDSVTSFGYRAFYNCGSLTISCYENSYAHTYAVNNSISYELICDCKHTETEIVGAADATCVDDGYTGDTVCTACGTVISAGEIIPSAGSHAWNDGEITTAPGLTTEGVRTFTCTVCGDTMTEAIDAVGKDFVIEDGTIVGYLGIGGEVIIPEGVTAIGKYAFITNTDITSVVIPEGVTVIKKGAFTFCENLETVALPSTLETIETGAFAFCASLSDIIIPESVTELGTGAFSGCTSLGEIYISDNVATIGEDVFDGCASLTLRFYDTAPMADYAEESGVNYRLILCGDVDDNGSVNSSDVTILGRNLAGADVSVEYGADYNRDGKVNSSDLTVLRRKVAGADV